MRGRARSREGPAQKSHKGDMGGSDFFWVFCTAMALDHSSLGGVNLASRIRAPAKKVDCLLLKREMKETHKGKGAIVQSKKIRFVRQWTLQTGLKNDAEETQPREIRLSGPVARE